MSAERKALIALVGLMLVSLIWLVDTHFESMWDAVLYVLTTRSLLAGDGYAVYGEPFHLRPPGFSLLLAPVMAVFGTNFLALNLFTSLLGVLALALAFVYVRPRLGITASFVVCASIWFNPQYQSLCNATLSDTAGLAALLGCLLVDRWAGRTSSAKRDVVLGLGIGLMGYLRAVGIVLIPAIVLGRLLGRQRERAEEPVLRRFGRLGLVVAVALATGLPWTLWKAAHPAPDEPEYQGIHSYWTAQWRNDPSNPESRVLSAGEILERVPERTWECLNGLGSRLPKLTLQGMVTGEEIHELRHANTRPYGLWLGCVAVASLLAITWRRRDAGSFFALGNLAVCLIYFDYDERLLVPIYLFALASFVELLRSELRRLTSTRLATAVPVLLVVVMGVSDAFPPNPREHVMYRNRINGLVAAYVREHYPPDVRIAASLGHNLAVYFDRPIHFLEVAVGKRGWEGGLETAAERRIQVLIHTGKENGWMEDRLARITKYGVMVKRIANVRIYEFATLRGVRDEPEDEPEEAPGG